MDQADFVAPDNKIQKVKQANESRSTKLSGENQENKGLDLAPLSIPVVSIKSTPSKSNILRKRTVKPKLVKEKLVTKS